MVINQMLGNFLPNIYIDKILLKDTEVEVSFYFKETLLENNKFSISSYDILKKYILIKIEKVIERSDFEEAKLAKTSNIGTETNTYKLLDIISLDKKAENNGTIYRYYTTTFSLQKPINNLGFILYSELDYDGISRDLRFSFDRTKFNTQKNYEDVIFEGKIVEISEKFVDSNNSEWYGGVTQIFNNNTYTYFTTETPRRLLQKVQYKNTKIQDFRIESTQLLQIQRQNTVNPLSVSDTSNFYFNRTFTKNLLDSFSSRQEIITDYYDIIDDNNYVSFVFCINFKNLIYQQTNYVFNFINDGNIDKVIEKIDLKSCRLYRTQKIDAKANNSNYILSETRELVSDSFKEYELVPNLKDKKTFLIKDSTSNLIKSGFYEYSLELDVKNGIVDYLNEKINILYKDQKNFISYNNLINLPQYYDKQTNFFKKDESEKIYQQFNIEQIIVNFVRISGELNYFTTDEIQQFINKYKSYTNPSTATSKSIQYVLELHKELLNNLLKYSGTTIDYDGFIINKVPYKGALININKKFKNLIDLNKQFEVKLNFIDIPDNIIDYRNILFSFDRLFEQYKLDDISNSAKENVYSCLPPKMVIINGEKKQISLRRQSGFNSENYLDYIFTQINLNINKFTKYKLQLNESSNQNNDVMNLLNFSKIIEQHGATIDSNIIKPQVTNILNLTEDAYYNSNGSLYNCAKGLVKSFAFDAGKYSEVKQKFDNDEKFSETIPVITSIGFSEANRQSDMNTLFTSGKYIILYRILYDLEFLDFKDGKFVWNKLNKTLFERNFRNRTCLFRLRQNNSPTTYDTSNIKTTNHFIVNFR